MKTKNELNEYILRKLDERDKLVSKISNDDLNINVQGHEDGWTTIDVVKHIVQSEKGMIQLIQKIILTGQGVPEDFDLNRYNKSQVKKLETISFGNLLEKLSQNKTDLVSLLDTVDESDYSKRGRHATGKLYSVEEIFQVIVDHDIYHLNQVLQHIQNQDN